MSKEQYIEFPEEYTRRELNATNPVNIFHCSAFIIGFQTSLSVEQQNFCKAHNT